MNTATWVRLRWHSFLREVSLHINSREWARQEQVEAIAKGWRDYQKRNP